MNTQHQDQQPGHAPASVPAQPHPARSEGLLPADDESDLPQVAEEVSFDIESDGARRIGAPPQDTPIGKPAEAMADAIAPAPADAGAEGLKEAIERAVPSLSDDRNASQTR